MYCSYCGKPNPDDFRFCSSCGKARPEATTHPSTKTREQAEQELGASLDGMFDNILKDTIEKAQAISVSREFIKQLQVNLANTLREALEQNRIPLRLCRKIIFPLCDYAYAG